jgi:hypothetical protein
LRKCCGGVTAGNIYAKYPELKGDTIMLFKALEGFNGVQHESGGKIYTFYTDKPTEAPESFKVHENTIVVTEMTKKETIEIPVEYDKKGDNK